MTKPRESQAARLERMRVLLDNLKVEEIKTAVATVGITDAVIGEGEQIYAAAEQAIKTQDALDAKLNGVRDALNAAREEAYATYMEYFQVAQIRIKVPELRALLELEGARETTLDELHRQMRRFYESAKDAAAEAALVRYGIWLEELEHGRNLLTKVEQLDSGEAMARARKEHATEVQTAALDAMDAWYDDKLAGATYATRHKPQLMEALGKTVR